MKITLPLVTVVTGLLVTTSACADTPAFDRPGIAFSTQTLPPRSFDWEQGLPDVVRDNDHGTESTLYSADTRIRVGLTSILELQIAGSLFNELQTQSSDGSTVDRGVGDSTLALKLALPATQKISWAILGGVSFATGKEPFTSDTQQYLLAVSTSVHIDDDYTAGVYVGGNRSGRSNIYTLSPNFSFPLRAHLGGYVEIGYTFGSHTYKNEVAGGGLAWMASDKVQLDLYTLLGLTEHSTELQAGLGLSVFVP